MAVYKRDMVDINLETGNIHRSFLKHSIGKADSAADQFGIRVFRDGEPVDLSGVSVHGYFRDPQGNNIAITTGNNIDGNIAEVVLPQACYNYEGQFCLAIKLVGGGVTGTMRIVDGMVDNTNTSGAVAPTETVPTYQEILAQYDAMVAATAAANGCIAETFDATKEYSAGKYVINSGALYRLPAGHAANVTWANTSKTEVNFGDELAGEVSTLSGAITNLGNGLDNRYVPVSLTWTNEKRLDGSGAIVNATTAFYVSQEIEIDSFYLITVNGINNVNATQGSCYAIYNSAGTVLEHDAIIGSFVLEKSELPAGASSIRFCHYATESYPLSGVSVSLTYSERIDSLETNVTELIDEVGSIMEEPETLSLVFTNQKRLNGSGAIVGATTSFSIAQIDLQSSYIYKITVSGLNTLANDGSSISFFDSNNQPIANAHYNVYGAIFTKDNIPAGARYLYLSQYITSTTPVSDVVAVVSHSEVREAIDNVEDEVGIIVQTLDDSCKNVLKGATTFTDNWFINDQGKAATNSNFCLIDGFYPVKPNTVYKLYRGEPPLYSNAGHNWTFWDESKTFISYTLTAQPVTSPANAAYLRFAVYISNTGSATHANFDPSNVIITEDGHPCFDTYFTTGLTARPTLTGLKWIGVGDSITEDNFRAAFHYWSYVQAETGLNFVNMGVSGTGYKAEGSGDKAFYKRVASIATDAQVITIFGGVNDVVLSNATIGTATDTGTETICGCVNTTIDTIEARYKENMPIGIISPLPCYCTDTSVNLHPYQRPDDTTCRMSQFVEQLAIICNRRGIPFLDLFHQSNLRPWYSQCNAKYFSCDSAPNGDGLHPNGHGHRLFYRQIMQFVEKLAMN